MHSPSASLRSLTSPSSTTKLDDLANMRQQLAYLQGLALHFTTPGSLPLARMRTYQDERISTRLPPTEELLLLRAEHDDLQRKYNEVVSCEAAGKRLETRCQALEHAVASLQRDNTELKQQLWHM